MVPTLPDVRAVLLVIAGAVISVLAFPPFGPGWLVVVGVTLFLTGLRLAEDRGKGLSLGAIYGLTFFGGLLWWISGLGVIAVIPLVLSQAAFLAVYGWWLVKYNDRSPSTWLLLAVGGWAVMELIRYHFPFGGLEWGAAGYALSDHILTRLPAATVGTTGLTVLVVLIGAVIASALARRWDRRLMWSALVVGAVLLASVVPLFGQPIPGVGFPVNIVQGSTPCPFEHCPPNERLRTYEQHLALTQTITAPGGWLVVWSEGSTGSSNADPVQNPDVGESIGLEAERLGSWMLVGSDRPISDTEWINANVVFDAQGKIVGEYRKQHPVPFGEYIPLRPLFDWIPALSQVPRDMIPGDGPVVFDTGTFKLGSVISFEGSFSRYPLQHRRAGAEVIVVATNEGSYGLTPASDQLIGMTRMRAVELGVAVLHAAVTGKSAVIGPRGDIDETTDLGTQEVLSGLLDLPLRRTPYSYTGDLLMYLVAILGILTWWRARSLVGSGDHTLEEE